MQTGLQIVLRQQVELLRLLAGGLSPFSPAFAATAAPWSSPIPL